MGQTLYKVSQLNKKSNLITILFHISIKTQTDLTENSFMILMKSSTILWKLDQLALYQ